MPGFPASRRWSSARLLPGLLLLLSALRAGAEDDGRDVWLVVTRPMFEAALAPLAEHRRTQGLAVEVTTRSVREALGGRDAPPAFLLLVGDDAPGAADAPWRVPAPRSSLYRWTPRQRADFPSDASLGDLDGDHLPDVPVGRIPARTVEELEAVVAKIVAYERETPTADDLRVLAWAGAPGYGKLLDSMATSFLVQTVRSRAPAWAGRFLISAAPDHPLAGSLPDQPSVFNAELGRGAVLGSVDGDAIGLRPKAEKGGSEGRQVLGQAP